MNNDVEVVDLLRQLASTVPSEADGNVEQKLVMAFRARQPRRRAVWIYAAAAVLVGIAFLVGSKTFRQQPVSAEGIYTAPGFVALPYAESGVPMESAVVIRVQVRSSELASMGVAMPAEAATSKFKADFLVGQDGVPRAVRLVQ